MSIFRSTVYVLCVDVFSCDWMFLFYFLYIKGKDWEGSSLFVWYPPDAHGHCVDRSSSSFINTTSFFFFYFLLGLFAHCFELKSAVLLLKLDWRWNSSDEQTLDVDKWKKKNNRPKLEKNKSVYICQAVSNLKPKAVDR